ncbi:hypothetical protein CAAN3_01S03158 [[Candida] anglica]
MGKGANMFLTDDDKYQALKHRNPKAEGSFVYCVLSTGIVCRPTCSSRLALRKNIKYYQNVQEAIHDSFRPCKRCKPDVPTEWNPQNNFVIKSCKMIYEYASSKTSLDIDEIIKELKISKWYFYRTFKIYTHMTPRMFYKQCLKGTYQVANVPMIQTKRDAIKKKEIVQSICQETKEYLHDLSTDKILQCI